MSGPFPSRPVPSRAADAPAVASQEAASRPRRWMRLLADVAMFEAAWFACVLGAAHDRVPAGVLAVAIVVGMQWIASDARRSDAWLVLAALAIGALWDGALSRWQVVEYAAPGPLGAGFAPVWILALWALFAMMLRNPLRWLHDRPWPAALLGGVGGWLSYRGAAALGACRFPDPLQAAAVLSIGWAVITPLLLGLARRLDPEVRMGKGGRA